MIQGEYNGTAIQILCADGKEACWEYIKSIPAGFRSGCVSTIKTIQKVRGNAKEK